MVNTGARQREWSGQAIDASDQRRARPAIKRTLNGWISRSAMKTREGNHPDNFTASLRKPRGNDRFCGQIKMCRRSISDVVIALSFRTFAEPDRPRAKTVFIA